MALSKAKRAYFNGKTHFGKTQNCLEGVIYQQHVFKPVCLCIARPSQTLIVLWFRNPQEHIKSDKESATYLVEISAGG